MTHSKFINMIISSFRKLENNIDTLGKALLLFDSDEPNYLQTVKLIKEYKEQKEAQGKILEILLSANDNDLDKAIKLAIETNFIVYEKTTPNEETNSNDTILKK